MARMTKAQREWRPGMKKKRRSIRVMFASTVLTLEAFVFLFATMSLAGLRGDELGNTLVWSVGLALAVVSILTCALLRKPFGYWIGWTLQLVLIAAGFLDYFLFVIGALFAVAWWYAVTKGAQMDAENLERDAAQEAWEAEHGDAA
ncbi:DUF4233 domain-containing protein [Zhihengliuella halotolerans]|uniref:Uncharacterized protein DUF4233 n=1 Tax=Zhihengliuella halotolerans TaxID=370736 RepID=A0A4Q8AAZ2_9MICC|nr:DUF4233 domain-containing protein [Zhihengliuella halotolerans]RZU61312.1 uncharacterized protein DUF4233 [Zhihengliuella halotolerans]